MQTKHTVESLKAFELDIASEFNAGNIRAPVHLSGGNEEPLLRIFDRVEPHDWVLTTWRSHYHCLLKGVPADQLRADIIAGHSITLCYPGHRILSSAIVGGILPISVGIAMAIKRQGRDERVWCFVGDMSSHTGAYHESVRYAYGHGLGITFVCEDNEKSVATPTGEVWGNNLDPNRPVAVDYYKYKLSWPHTGAGTWVNF